MRGWVWPLIDATLTAVGALALMLWLADVLPDILR